MERDPPRRLSKVGASTIGFLHFWNRCWRPLVGPNDDWPLVLCDHVFVADDDKVKNDDIHFDRVYENMLLHPNDVHRWYYIPGQMPEDLIVLRNSDSNDRRARKLITRTSLFAPILVTMTWRLC